MYKRSNSVLSLYVAYSKGGGGIELLSLVHVKEDNMF